VLPDFSRELEMNSKCEHEKKIMFPSVYLSVRNSESVTAIDRLMIKHPC
jgi:hypothetical protein